MIILLLRGSLAVATIVDYSVWAQTTNKLTATDLFKKLEPRIFVVEALDRNNEVLAIGSAVAIGGSQLITNRHVIEGAIRIRLRKGNLSYVANPIYISNKYDLCQLSAPSITVPALSMRLSSQLEIGETVYALGNPQGLETSLSEGIISGLRSWDKSRIVQTTAAISPGSSGGGLFDVQARLIGVTTSYLVDGQNLNFALPCEFVLSLSEERNSPKEGPDTSGNINREQSKEDIKKNNDKDEYMALSFFEQGIRLYQKGKYQEAQLAFQNALRSRPDDPVIWSNYGLSLEKTFKYAQAIQAHQEAIRLDATYPNAWCNLCSAQLTANNPKAAIESCKQALKLKPDYADAHNNLGVAYVRTDSYMAISSFWSAVRADPKLGSAWYNLGEAYSKLNDRESLMKVYKQLQEVDPVYADKLFRWHVLK